MSKAVQIQNQVVQTLKQKEAIYPYADNGPMIPSDPDDPVELSLQENVSIKLLFSDGARKLVIVEDGVTKQFELRSPKKPENTPTTLLIGPHKFKLSKEIADLLPAPISIKK